MYIKYLISAFLCFSLNGLTSASFYPKYHLAPEKGWMNDPNGFCYFNGVFHLFYQYNPYSSSEPGIAHWGHAVSEDLISWKHLPVAMSPDKWYDVGGVFSGSCLVEDDKMYLYYTGNVNNPGETPDHNQYQALATSDDGYTVTKYESNPIINGSEYQPNIRDPKVWKHNDKYYMVLGNSFQSKSNETLGRVLLWTSSDKLNWEVASVLLESKGALGDLGYMFECPDFFELDGYWVLLFSPQGIKPQGDKYRNLYQTGYVIGSFDYESNSFKPLSKFKELDHGHDFYATQTTLDKDGNRIVIAWLDMWENKYPEKGQGFTGQMTVPRVLKATKDGRLIQKPVQEISNARGSTLYSGAVRGDNVITLENNAADVFIQSSGKKGLDLIIQSEESSVVIRYNALLGTVSLNRGGEDGVRRTKWRPRGKLVWQLYIDSSSIELFCGEGEVTFSSRFFPKGDVKLRLGKFSDADKVVVTSMKQTVDITEPEVSQT